MTPMSRFDVFQLLVEQSCERSAAGLWLDLFDKLVKRQVLAVGDALEADHRAIAKAAVASEAGEEIRHMFEWLASVMFHRTSITTEALPPGALDTAASIRKRITQGCVRLIDERSSDGEWDPGFKEMLMELWEDGYGNLLSRSIREVRTAAQNT